MLLYRRLGVIFPLARMNRIVPYSSVRAAQRSSPDEPSTATPVGEKIQVLVDQIAGLSLLEVGKWGSLDEVELKTMNLGGRSQQRAQKATKHSRHANVRSWNGSSGRCERT